MHKATACLFAVIAASCGRLGFDRPGGDASQDGRDGDAQGGSHDGPAASRWLLITTEAIANSTMFPIAPTGSGNLIVLEIASRTLGNTVTGITDNAPNGGNIYAAIPQGRAVNGVESLEIWYAKGSQSGATVIDVAVTGAITSLVLWEVAGIRTDAPLDTADKLDAQPATTTPVGPSLTTIAPGDFIVSVVISQNSITGIHAGNEFTQDQMTQLDGWGHLTASSAAAGTHQAQWDQPTSGSYCANAAAFRVGP